MKKTLLLSTVAAALAVATAAQAAFISGTGGAQNAPISGAMTVGFDSSASGVFASVTDGAVTVTGVGAPLTVGTDYNGSYNTGGGKSVYNDFDLVPDSFRIDFASPVSAFAFNWGAADNTWTLDVYDSSNTLIGTAGMGPVYGSNAGDYYGWSGGSIAYAVLTDTLDNIQSGDYVFIDYVTFGGGSDNVPEPATMTIWGLGALGCAVAAYRRKKQAA